MCEVQISIRYKIVPLDVSFVRASSTIVKVTYDSELTGNHVTYRCIV
jgi:DNA-directed RNA polymerase subunit H (RpoH/RPB5)